MNNALAFGNHAAIDHDLIQCFIQTFICSIATNGDPWPEVPVHFIFIFPPTKQHRKRLRIPIHRPIELRRKIIQPAFVQPQFCICIKLIVLIKSVYRKQALVPASPWLSKNIPAAPAVTTSTENNSVRIFWTHPDAANVFHWVVYYQSSSRWNYVILNGNAKSFTFPSAANSSQMIKKIILTAVDRLGNESEKREVEIK